MKNVRKVRIVAMGLITAAALTLGQSASAQIRLGAVSAVHLSSAASLNGAAVSNALRATGNSAVNGTNKTVAVTRRIEGKTTTAVHQTASAAGNAAPPAGANEAAAVSSVSGVKNGSQAGAASASYARVSASTTASVQKQ